MNIVKEQHGTYTIQVTNAIESIGLTKQKVTFRKLWIYQGTPDVVTGLLTDNAGTVYVGKDGDGPRIVPDSIAPGDPPLLIQLPDNKDESMLLKDILIKGTAGDAVFFSYWP